MGVEIKTEIDEAKLEEWQQRVPEQEIFLANFFLSCGPYSPTNNRLNYQYDITAYGFDDKKDELLKAYDDIVKI